MDRTVPTGAWRRSSFSNGGGACVEVRCDPTATLVRDSKDVTGGVPLVVPPGAFTALLATARRAPRGGTMARIGTRVTFAGGDKENEDHELGGE